MILLQNCLANNLPTKSKNWPKLSGQKVLLLSHKAKAVFAWRGSKTDQKLLRKKQNCILACSFEQFLLPGSGQFPDLLRIRRQKLLKNCPARETDQKLPSKKQFCYQKAKLLFGPKLVGKIIDQKLLGSLRRSKGSFDKRFFCLKMPSK